MNDTAMVLKAVGAIMPRLFEAEDRRLVANVNRIAKLNDEACTTRNGWFLYQGKVYMSTDTTTQPSGAGGYPQLVRSLDSTMREHLRDATEVANDRDQIRQILCTLLYNCTTLQELRDTLPAFLVPLYKTIADMQPRYPQGHCAPKHERFVAQYAKILPKIEFYAGTRLLY